MQVSILFSNNRNSKNLVYDYFKHTISCSSSSWNRPVCVQYAQNSSCTVKVLGKSRDTKSGPSHVERGVDASKRSISGLAPSQASYFLLFFDVLLGWMFSGLLSPPPYPFLLHLYVRDPADGHGLSNSLGQETSADSPLKTGHVLY
jgi:hypothetical protein